MTTNHRQLLSIHCSFWKNQRIVFRYSQGRWQFFESFRPLDIREALRVTLEKIEEANPGALAKASVLDDKNWLCTKRRTRRYIAESADLIYIDSPHLRNQTVRIAGHRVLTNIPWRDVGVVLMLVCKAVGVEYGSLSKLSF